MAQDLSQDQFDIACLRHIVADPEARRASLAAAMIKLHALAIARSTPDLREEALEIVKYSERLYFGLPDRASLARVICEHPASARLRGQAINDLVEAVWDHLRRGKS